jgi:hypothetical protein
MTAPDSGGRPDLLPGLAVGLVGLVVAGDLLLVAAPGLAGEPPRFLLVGTAVVAGTAVLAVGVRRSPTAGFAALLALPVVAVYAYTGVLLPWTQASFALGQRLVELTLAVPVVGSSAARLLFGGFTLSQATLDRAFALHYAVVALAGLAVCSTVARRVARRL